MKFIAKKLTKNTHLINPSFSLKAARGIISSIISFDVKASIWPEKRNSMNTLKIKPDKYKSIICRPNAFLKG